MKPTNHTRTLLSVLLLGLVATSTARGTGGVSLSQHGGRGLGQVGALTARADDPSAVSYNPAGLVHLPGVQLQAGLDFMAPRDDYESATGSYSAQHTIQFPPALYVTWRLPEDRVPLAFGFGIDSPVWHLVTWQEALYPGRYLTRKQELTILDFAFTAAYPLSSEWSIGGSAHYLRGDLGEGNNHWVTADGSSGPVPLEVERLAESTVDGLAFDLAVQLKKASWGWGAVVRSATEVAGKGDVTYRVRDVPPDPELEQGVFDRFTTGSSTQAFDLPWEARTGFWYAPYPELRLELDLAYEGWSVVESTTVTYRPDPVDEESETTETRERQWEDTLNVRLGVEGDITDEWVFFGGLGYQGSPVPTETLEPGFPRGDTWIMGLGFSYNLETLSFDAGYSYHISADRSATGQELAAPEITSDYSSRAQVFGVSVRWRW